jgi:hypothetical protein
LEASHLVDGIRAKVYSCQHVLDTEETIMPDTVMRVQYFYTEVPDKPGEGARILTMFRDAGVNLLAYSGFPKGRRAQLDFIPAEVAAFRAACRKAKLPLVGPKTGFLIHGEDRPGALAELIAKLAAAKLNVTACEAVAAGEGRYGAILWVKPPDVQKAAKVLGAGKEARPTATKGRSGASPGPPDDSAAG